MAMHGLKQRVENRYVRYERGLCQLKQGNQGHYYMAYPSAFNAFPALYTQQRYLEPVSPLDTVREFCPVRVNLESAHVGPKLWFRGEDQKSLEKWLKWADLREGQYYTVVAITTWESLPSVTEYINDVETLDQLGRKQRGCPAEIMHQKQLHKQFVMPNPSLVTSMSTNYVAVIDSE